MHGMYDIQQANAQQINQFRIMNFTAETCRSSLRLMYDLHLIVFTCWCESNCPLLTLRQQTDKTSTVLFHLHELCKAVYKINTKC